MMHKLNLPDYQLNIRESASGIEVYDVFRRRFVALTPEEWVRQNFLHYLLKVKSYPSGLIAVEKGIRVNGMLKRFDAVVFDKAGTPCLLLEFKAPDVKISQDTFDQASRYNLSLNVDYLIITNGLSHYCARIDAEKNEISFLEEIPNYDLINHVR